MKLQRTPLYELCEKAGARMVPFAGWQMPVQFSGLINEHHAVRNEIGFFDISHMGVIQLSGKNPKDALQALVPSDLNRIGPGEACYTVLLNENGGILDDLIIYDLGPDKTGNQIIFLVINAACATNDIEWLNQHLQTKELSLTDAKNDQILLAIQGPKSLQLLDKLSNESLQSLPRFGHRYIHMDSLGINKKHAIFIARTGYTGEEGFELLLPKETGKLLWQMLLSEGATACGLGARDTLRLEAALHLYGNDISSETTPFEAGLGWLVHLEMPIQFLGRRALEKQAEQGIEKVLVGLKLKGRAIARHNYPVLHEGKKIGKITSGSWSPTLNEAIALAYVPLELSKVGSNLEVEIRNQRHSATVVKKPFYRKA